MKRTVIAVALICLLAGLAPKPVQAETDAQLFASLGLMTDDSFKFKDFLWHLGLNLDLTLNDFLMLSPEVNLVTRNFKFKAFLLEPAVLLNIKFSDSFFAGAGISKFMVIAEGDYFGSTDVALKANVGFFDEHFKFRIYVITPFNDLFKYSLIGLQAGLSF